MANRFPLIVNAVDAKIYELASGDNLDLTGSGIYNGTATLTLPTASGTLATLAGTETFTNKTLTTPTIYNPIFSQNGGDEGGEVKFALAATNTTLSTSVTVDVYQNKLRIFETGGTVRGASLDISALSAAVGSDIVINNVAQTLTNKTLTSPSIAGGALSGTFSGDHTYSGTVTLSATTSLTIPVGTTAQRPTATTGQIRFNSTLTSFEGYNGTAWSSLGGVKSVDGFTYILAETSSGASNGELEFYAENAAGNAAAKQGGWNYTRLLTNTPVDFAGSTSGTTRVQATAAASGTLTLPAATDTLVGRATTDTLTNKTINLASNTLTATSAQIAAAVSDESGSGHLVFDTSPTFTTSVLADTTTFSVFNTTATTINAFGAATTLSLGAGTGTTTVNNNMVVTGNLTVNGTTTTVNSTTITVDDITLELGSVTTPSDVTANGGGIILKGATDKSITWSTTGWTSSEDFNLVTGKAYEINGTSVLNATTLGSGVTTSSLTSVGTITSGTWSGSFGAVSGANLTSLTAGNLTGTIPSAVLGNSTHYIGTTAVTLNRGSANQGLTGISSIALPGSTSGTITVTPAATAGTTAITIPATSGTLVTTGDTGTVTNTMLAGSIANAKLANSTISGVALGSNLATLTLGVSGTGLSGSTTYNGSGAATFTVTSNATSANTGSAIVARDASGNFSAGTITAALSGNASTATTATNQSGGTVAATTGSFSGQITSTVANGTAPMVVTSTTKVTNLNVELVDGYHADIANTASTIAVRNSQGTINASGFNASSGIIENSATISANYTIATGNNAMSAGPVSIANGVTVTVPTGSVWTIV